MLQYNYSGKAAALRKELVRLQQQGLLQRRSISVGKNRDTLVVLALTRVGVHVARQDNKLPEQQAIYSGLVKPAEVPHGAGIYRMYQAKAPQIEARGGKIPRSTAKLPTPQNGFWLLRTSKFVVRTVLQLRRLFSSHP